MTIQIVTVTNDMYAKHLAVMLISLLENKVSDTPINISVICKNLSKENKIKLSKSIKKFNVQPNFLEINNLIYKGFITKWHLTEETYYRISIPELFDKKIKKVLYLDCDIIVKEDITKLWNININDYCLAAVEDKKIGKSRNQALSIPQNSSYFNAGVLVMNIENWRKSKISEKIIQFIKNNPSKIELCSQDPLNAILHDQWLKLDAKWNYQTAHHSSSSDQIKPAIIHFTEYGKPWNYGHPLQDEYFHYLQKTLW